ncbi:MAG TPA: IclR family transcriptional regulator [Gemmatimonadaceae bacterium]|nr:IclR family transcriptional regulator [Gemmatimonadaceae bacterium]
MKPGSNFSPLPGTQAVVRAISVLKTLGQSRSAFAMTDLGTATGLSKATIFRLLGALEHEGMVARDAATGGYRLGPELITLGVTALSATDLRTTAHDELAHLAEASGETATLEVLLGWDVLIIDEVQGRFLLGSTPEIGRRWPAHATSTGKLLLALGTPPHFPPRLARLTPRTVVSRVELQRELSRVRRRGYASAVDELELGLVALAAPIRNHLGAPVAALSINGPSLRLGVKRRRQLLHTLCQAANRVSRRLGATAAMLEVIPADGLRTNSNPSTS